MNTTSLEKQLRPTTAEGAPEALVPARLLRGSWLVEQADKRHELLQRQEPFQQLALEVYLELGRRQVILADSDKISFLGQDMFFLGQTELIWGINF